jgi:hypothetical protein
MAKIPVLDAVRIIPRDADFLDRRSGNRGEIFYDRTTNTLRLYDGATASGINLAKSDLTNIDNTVFRAKSVESRISTVVYTVTVTGPQSPDTGNKYNLNSVYRPEPNFVVGYTYVFVQDDQSNVFFPNANGTTPNPHPLNFSADNLSGLLGGGTSYLTNVRYFLNGAVVTQAVYNSAAFNTATSRQVWITVTNSTPSTLYYWCYNHLAMGNAISVADPGSESGGNVTVSVSENVPASPLNGNLWLSTETGALYVYINDGDSNQWIQPAVPTVDLTGFATEDYVDNAVANVSNLNLATVATTGSYTDLSNKPTSFNNLTTLSLINGGSINEFSSDATLGGNSNSAVPTEAAVKSYVDAAIGNIDTGSVAVSDLTDVQISGSITVGHVLKWNGTRWAPAVDATVGGAGTDADTLNGQNGSYYLNYANLSGTPNLNDYALKNNPSFTGNITIGGITSTGVTGTGKLVFDTNPSLASASLSNTAFTGTVTGLTATMVGLGNVTNESKATMFSSPTFSGTVTAPTVLMATGGFSITQSGTKLLFRYNGVNIASMDSSGNIISSANITAYGTP